MEYREAGQHLVCSFNFMDVTLNHRGAVGESWHSLAAPVPLLSRTTPNIKKSDDMHMSAV